jgi:hypothetical protein
LIACDVTLEQAPADMAYLALDVDADAETVARRIRWLGA